MTYSQCLRWIILSPSCIPYVLMHNYLLTIFKFSFISFDRLVHHFVRMQLHSMQSEAHVYLNGREFAFSSRNATRRGSARPEADDRKKKTRWRPYIFGQSQHSIWCLHQFSIKALLRFDLYCFYNINGAL